MTIESHTSSDLPPHKPRRSDADPRAAKRAERQVGFMFIASGLASAAFLVGGLCRQRLADHRLAGKLRMQSNQGQLAVLVCLSHRGRQRVLETCKRRERSLRPRTEPAAEI